MDATFTTAAAAAAATAERDRRNGGGRASVTTRGEEGEMYQIVDTFNGTPRGGALASREEAEAIVDRLNRDYPGPDGDPRWVVVEADEEPAPAPSVQATRRLAWMAVARAAWVRAEMHLRRGDRRGCISSARLALRAEEYARQAAESIIIGPGAPEPGDELRPLIAAGAAVRDEALASARRAAEPVARAAEEEARRRREAERAAARSAKWEARRAQERAAADDALARARALVGKVMAVTQTYPIWHADNAACRLGGYEARLAEMTDRPLSEAGGRHVARVDAVETLGSRIRLRATLVGPADAPAPKAPEPTADEREAAKTAALRAAVEAGYRRATMATEDWAVVMDGPRPRPDGKVLNTIGARKRAVVRLAVEAGEVVVAEVIG